MNAAMLLEQETQQTNKCNNSTWHITYRRVFMSPDDPVIKIQQVREKTSSFGLFAASEQLSSALASGTRCDANYFSSIFWDNFCAGREGKLLICKVLFLFVFPCCLPNTLIRFMQRLADSATLFPIIPGWIFTSFIDSFEVSVYFHYVFM